VSAPAAQRGSARPRARGFGRAAVLVGAITVVARVAGFGRQLVFAHTVRTYCLGTAYTTANTVPNIIYDIVLGGALSAVVVPVLAGPAGAGDEEDTRRISSALLTWTVLLLAPVSAVLALAARPVASALLGTVPHCPTASLHAVGGRMLLVFAPQILLYGLAVVLYGILQSHRRFAAPALAPLLSSLVVVGAYAGFGVVGEAYVNRLDALPPGDELLLSGGTTLGVLALVLTPLVPFARLRLRLRPALRFPDGIGARVRRLAVAGVATLVAQDASAVVVIVLANHYGGSGALVLYSFAWAVFVVPYAVLAVPIATTAFPELSSERDRGFDTTAAASTRAVLMVSWLGTAAMAGACVPLARVFSGASALAAALVTFAPGLVGYGLTANLSRVLYAHGRTRAPAIAVSAGWALVIVFDVAVVPFARASQVVPLLGAGTTAGLTVAAVALVVLVRRTRGAAALAGSVRAAASGLAGCLAGAGCGLAVSLPLRVSGFFANAGMTVIACAAAGAGFLAVVLLADGGDLRAAIRRVISRAAS
jgi:peptidoglycan biosynthesis protein MviN/MurJ (putative lipid II flippase)